MKVVFASTSTQEERLNELIHLFYSHIFPTYFLDKEIKKFKQLKVLSITAEQSQVFSTLKTSYQVIASLQTLISILEDASNMEQYEHLFNKNVQILREFDVFFPFTIQNFLDKNKQVRKKENVSSFSEPTNQYLL